MENRIKLRSCKTNTSPVREDELQKPELGDGTSAFEGRFKATRMVKIFVLQFTTVFQSSVFSSGHSIWI